jgi:CBS domain-containing protein
MTQDPVATLSVGDLMTPDPIVIGGDEPLADAARLFDQHRIHGLPVVAADGALIGVISQTDMLRARTTEQLWAGWRGLKVRHLMTSPPLTIEADATVADAAAQLEANGVHRLVVLGADGRSPAGILSSSDIVRGMLSEGGPDVEEVGR